MTESNQTYSIKPADRLAQVAEYYFSRKLKEIDRLNAEGKDIISLAIGSPDMPPSQATVDKLCEVARQAGAHGYQPTSGTPELRHAGTEWTSTRKPKCSHSSARRKEYST